VKRDALAKLVLATIVLLVPRNALSQNLAPLSIAREGYVYAGGKYATLNSRQGMSGQLYAEYQIPTQLLHPYPIVMVHGAGSSGATFIGTPDGREGWAQFFLRQDYAVPGVVGPHTFQTFTGLDLRWRPLKHFNSGLHAPRTTICGPKRICIRSGQEQENQATAVLTHSWHRACLSFPISHCNKC